MRKKPQIISISRRTDIPAYYSEWLINRMKKGYTVYPNPVSGKPVFISLHPNYVKILVFWTRNPLPMIKHLDYIDQRYRHYMHVTINGLPKILECNNPSVDSIINAVKLLSKRYGKHYVQWRFDPIILSTVTPEDFILRRFEYIASQLNGYIKNCYISFVDLYKKTEINFEKETQRHRIKFITPTKIEETRVTSKLVQIAEKYNITINTCAEDHLAEIENVEIGQCINVGLINQIIDNPIINYKIQKSRPGCHCMNAPDIGYYNSCPHGCIYCYSNKSPEIALKNSKLYRDMGFPMDELKMPGTENQQLSLFGSI